MASKPDIITDWIYTYDPIVAQIAGNILSGMTRIDAPDEMTERMAAEWAVKVARFIVAETKRTEPKAEGSPVNGAT